MLAGDETSIWVKGESVNLGNISIKSTCLSQDPVQGWLHHLDAFQGGQGSLDGVRRTRQ